MAVDVVAYALSKKYTQDTADGLGWVKGANCTIEKIEKIQGQNTITFKWISNSGVEETTTMTVDDGTPIYVWESGYSYEYGDICIYNSAFYRCITKNNDLTFNDTKWNEIGSPDGSYDIIEDSKSLPVRFTAADRKLYYSIADGYFYLWNGKKWMPQTETDNIDFSSFF
jgi:hypothetical protein